MNGVSENETVQGVLTVAEVAERLRISPTTVQRWLRSGKLRGTRIGGTTAGWRIRSVEVERLLEPSIEPARKAG